MAKNITKLADELIEFLRPACERISIAGSIRRGKVNPRDIEIVCIPKTVTLFTNDLFGNVINETQTSAIYGALSDLFSEGAWDFDPEVKRNGPKYKRLRHNETKICCDLFLTTIECWGVIFAIRTGPSDYSKELVTRARRLDMVVENGNLYRVHRDNQRDLVPTPNEVDFFKALGLPWAEPENRQ